MNPHEEADLRSQLFPTYGNRPATPPQPTAPVPKPPTPATPPPPSLGNTFKASPLSVEDESVKQFWKMVGLNLLLYVASFSVTLAHIPGTFGSLVFLICNPLSYFILALIISTILGFHHKKKAQENHSVASFYFLKALIGTTVVLAFVIALLYFIIF